MATVDYISRRGKRVMTRELDIVVDQFPGDVRRLVGVRPNGKKLMFHLPGNTLRQRRDDESKWTQTGRITAVNDLVIEDECPECGHEIGELRRDVVVHDGNTKPWVGMGGTWNVECTNCGHVHDPKTEPNEPPWPEPDDLDNATEVLEEVRKYATHVNDEIFGSRIDLNRVSWSWNSHKSAVAGEAWHNKVELTSGYLDSHSWNEFLHIVRHELVHVWEEHNNGGAGHDAEFHDWLVKANTRRHCKAF